MSNALVQELHGLVSRGEWQKAFALGNKLLNENYETPEVLYLVGATCRALNFLGLAMVVLSKALSKERMQPNLWMTYAATLHDLNKWEEAEKAFSVVHSMLPQDPMPIANIGATYVQRGMWRDAVNWCDQALSLDSDNHIARISKGFGLLSLGRWKDAWEYHDALYGRHLNVRVYKDPPEPEWDGSKGKTVVVQCDQGIGDQIMFSQCLHEMVSDCKKVIIECAQRMVPFFKRNFPECEVHGTGKDPVVDWDTDDVDAHVHMSYLGKFYRNTDKDFPRRAYATPDPELVEKWRKWLEKLPKPWIGVSWKGGIQATQTHLRSIKLEDLRPVLNMKGSFIDLSYMDNQLEIARWNIDNESQVIVPPVDAKNYDDTIALLAALDEVITVTTSIVHVCGAIGRTAQVLVPQVAQWRYAYRFGDGTHMVWYPDSVKLYRQLPGENGWDMAINRVAKAMQKEMRKAA